jgi:DNA polymerase-3 subunit delta'
VSRADSNTGVDTYPWLAEHWNFLLQRLGSGRLAHALLIEGAAGNGKMLLASAMVKRLLCGQHGEQACGQCRSCTLLAGGAHPDYFQLQPEEDSEVIKVDQVRGLIAGLDLTSSISPRKVAFIHPAEAMNAASANALLKSLEEPPGDAVLILVSHNASRLPVTIRSRCQGISVKQPESSVVLDWLARRSGKSAAQVETALLAAGGSPLRAEAYLDSPSLDAWLAVGAALGRLLERPASVSMVSAELAELDPADLWRWLSMYCAQLVRGRMAGLPLRGLRDNPKLADKNLLQLQQEADVNRQLSTTTVRSDLLLQEWLIKWAEQVL